jgi:hypothetical protein
MDIRLHPQKRSALIIQSSFLSLLRQPFPEGLLRRPLLGGFFVQQQRGYSWFIGQHNLKYQ